MRKLGRMFPVLLSLVVVLFAFEGAAAARQNFTVSPGIYKSINKIHKMMAEERFDEALALTERTLGKRRINDHERSILLQTKGYIFTGQEIFPKAASAFEECLKVGVLPEATLRDTEYNLAQLYMVQENYPRVISLLEDWRKLVPVVSGDAWMILAGAYSQQKNFKTAMVYGENALKAQPNPKERWLGFMLSVYFELGKKWDVVATLKRLVTAYPKKSYWLQLAGMYLELERENEALAVYDLAYSQNYLEESKDLVQYARLALNGNVSYKAAAILEKGFEAGIVERTEKNLKLMANALLVSREPKRALPYLREGAAMSDNGELHLFIGQTLADLDRWGEAAQAYNDALHAGGLRNPGEALIMQGVAYTTAKQYKRAKMAFEKARGFKDHALTASQWLNHLTQKMN